ncbi:MAG: glycerol kinase GlpK [Bacteroidota bacterium]
MMENYILSLDQGTTSSRAILFDKRGQIQSLAQKEFRQIFPRDGWVEHNPNDIWSSQVAVAAESMSKLGINGKSLAGIGITNQRETTIVWDRETGEPVYNAIVWQDRRTASLCNKLKEEGLGQKIRQKTGLLIDSYFSATKIKWILDIVPGVREKAIKGKLAFGTVDSWLIWKLTQGRVHATDVSNASRTLLFNIHDMRWDEELLEIFDVPKSMMPEIRPSSGIIDVTNTSFFASKVPLAGVAGDQQAALFGQLCLEEGMVKNTYGTGCFVLLNTGTRPCDSKTSMVTTVAWQIGEEINYALEGSIFNAGTVVQWLRDEMGLIKDSSEIEELAEKVTNNGGVYMVPAFTGLGAPHWDPYARGAIFGLGRSSNKYHIARAALESIAFQTMDVMEEMKEISGIELKELRVDGGASVNNLLMQFQANLLDLPVVRPRINETTALGAAYLAGLATGFWKDRDELKKHWKVEKTFKPKSKPEKTVSMKLKWMEAVKRSRDWENPS